MRTHYLHPAALSLSRDPFISCRLCIQRHLQQRCAWLWAVPEVTQFASITDNNLTAVAAAQAVHSSTCNNAVYEAVGAARIDKNCSSGLVWWTVVFSFFELFLSQIPDFHSLWYAPQISYPL